MIAIRMVPQTFIKWKNDTMRLKKSFSFKIELRGHGDTGALVDVLP